MARDIVLIAGCAVISFVLAGALVMALAISVDVAVQIFADGYGSQDPASLAKTIVAWLFSGFLAFLLYIFLGGSKECLEVIMGG